MALPTITLDTTVADLYRRASPKNAHKCIGQVLCGANSGLRLNSHFPRNIKYLYQDSAFNSLPKEDLTDENKQLQRSLAMKYLSLIPQRDAFISGDTAVVLFNVDQTPEQIKHDKDEAQKTLEVLNVKQRPKTVFCPGPSHIPIKEHGIDQIAFKLALDGLKDYPTVCDLDTHWFLNSKAALAQSGLPTPRCQILELEGYAPASKTCCEHCLSNNDLYIPHNCTGPREAWFKSSSDRVISAMRSRSLPFVLKNQQTFGGAGTYVVNDEEQRAALLQDFENGLLRKLFSQVTEDNHRLGPGTVLISDLVADPVGDYGLTFFVTEEGSPIFLAVSEQMIDDNRAWIGSTINYSIQKALEAKFSPIMHLIAAWLHGYRYYGPVGADILETKAVPNAPQDSMANMNIVDLNIRTSGSLCLPLLRGHFESRGYLSASSFGITVKMARQEFVDQWREEFESGCLCILSWYEDTETRVSIADVAIGGESEQRLQEEIKKIRRSTDEVTF